MARARNIKPGFFKNYELADLGPYAQLLFSGLWCLADREGLLEDKPRLIKAEIFPYYDVNVDDLIKRLNESGFIRRYKVNGVSVIEVLNFKKHQNPHHTEKKSYLPSYDDGCELTVTSPSTHGEYLADSLIPDSLIPDSLIPDSLIPDSLIHSKSVCVDEPSEKIKKRVNGKTSEVQTILIEYGITGPLANDFITHRKHCGKNGKGAPITRTALEGFQREADSAGISIIEAIRTSIERNWVGFKADWIKPEIRGKPNVINHEFNDVPAKLARSIRNSQRWLEESEND